MIKKILYKLVWSAIFLIILALCLMQSDRIKDQVIHHAANELYAKTGYHLKVGEISLLLPFQIIAKNVSIEKDLSPGIEIGNLNIILNLFGLINDQLDFEIIKMEKFYLKNQEQESFVFNNIKGLLKLKEYKILSAFLMVDDNIRLDIQGEFSNDQFAIESTLNNDFGIVVQGNTLVSIKDEGIEASLEGSCHDISALASLGNGQLDDLKGTCSFQAKMASNYFQIEARVPYVEMEKFQIEQATLNISGKSIHSLETALFSLDIGKFKFLGDSFKHIPTLQGEWNGALENNRFMSQAKISGLTAQPIAINAQIPMAFSISPPQLALDRDSAIQGRLKLSGEIAQFLPFFGNDSANINGFTTLDVAVEGSINSPRITTKAEVAKGSFESLDLGAVFHSISLTIEGDNQTFVLKELSGESGLKGLVTGTGFMHMDPSKDFPFEVALKIQDAELLHLDFARGIASGDVEVRGTTKLAILEGTIITDSMYATIPEQIPALLETLDIIYINHPENESPPTQGPKSNKSWPINLNIFLKVPGNAKINAKDFSSEWKGGVQIAGTTDSPLVYGEFSVVKGEYTLNSKKLDIRQGTITFSGDPEKKTTIYAIASKDLDKIRADIILKGPLSSPSIAFRSNPPLSEKEVLSYLLFNRGLSDITPIQGSQLNQSITKINTDNAALDVLTKIRSKLGIDTIDISRNDTSDSNEVSLHVGKYLSDGIFISIDKAITADANRISLEANITNNIKAQVEVGDDQDHQVHIKWKKDY